MLKKGMRGGRRIAERVKVKVYKMIVRSAVWFFLDSNTEKKTRSGDSSE